MKSISINLDSPIEVAAFAITKNTDLARTIEQLDSVDRMIDNFGVLFGNKLVPDLRKYVRIRREEINLKSSIKKQKHGNTWDWIRSFRSAPSNITGMACHLSR